MLGRSEKKSRGRTTLNPNHLNIAYQLWKENVSKKNYGRRKKSHLRSKCNEDFGGLPHNTQSESPQEEPFLSACVPHGLLKQMLGTLGLSQHIKDVIHGINIYSFIIESLENHSHRLVRATQHLQLGHY